MRLNEIKSRGWRLPSTAYQDSLVAALWLVVADTPDDAAG